MFALLKSGKGIIIVDAGGGTIDISTYKKSKDSQAFEEIAAPQCMYTFFRLLFHHV